MSVQIWQTLKNISLLKNNICFAIGIFVKKFSLVLINLWAWIWFYYIKDIIIENCKLFWFIITPLTVVFYCKKNISINFVTNFFFLNQRQNSVCIKTTFLDQWCIFILKPHFNENLKCVMYLEFAQKNLKKKKN